MGVVNICVSVCPPNSGLVRWCFGILRQRLKKRWHINQIDPGKVALRSEMMRSTMCDNRPRLKRRVFLWSDGYTFVRQVDQKKKKYLSFSFFFCNVWFVCRITHYIPTHARTRTGTHRHTHQPSRSYNLCIGLVVLFGMVVFLKSLAFGFSFGFFNNILEKLKKKTNKQQLYNLEATFSQLFPTRKKNKIKFKKKKKKAVNNPESNRRDKKI